MIKLQPGNFSFKPRDKKRETQKFNSVYGRPYVIVKIIANLSFNVQDKTPGGMFKFPLTE